MISIILQCPKEYAGMGGVSGLKYEALKDFVEWNTPEGYSVKDIQKKYVPLLLSLGSSFISFINDKK